MSAATPSLHHHSRPGEARGPSTDGPGSIEELAEDGLGLTALRPGQADAVAALVAGRDVLAVMPTGYGKSAIYQLAGAARGGLTLVVSPLIALQRDQVEALSEHELGDAVLLNSTLGVEERRDALERIGAPGVRFAFLAPEQFRNDEVMEALSDAAPALFVVDECHCVTSWGHDFRPDYLGLAAVRAELGHPPLVGLTATAAPPVQQDIVERLELRDPEVVVAGFDRPNLFLQATFEEDAAVRDELVARRALKLSGRGHSGIVYAATRRHAEELAQAIRDRGGRAGAYHAGLSKPVRDGVHADFMASEIDVVVATVAFGMGIDKPDVRFVLHAGHADSLDSYYQEIGRAGRDGEAAHVELFFRHGDLGLRRYQTTPAPPPSELLIAVLEATARLGGSASVGELAATCGISGRRALRALHVLEDVGATEVDGDRTRIAARNPSQDRVIAEVEERHESRRAWAASRLEMMRDYAETRACRRYVLLSYFGDQAPRTCRRCDNCCDGSAAAVTAAPDVASTAGYAEGSRVAHVEWGEGEVIRTGPDELTVLFGSVGYKVLSIELVTAHDLLAPVG